MNILVLGSGGFIGSHLVDFYRNTEHTIYACDLFDSVADNTEYTQWSSDKDFWTTFFSDKKVDVCINAAGSGNVPYSIQHPVEDFNANCFEVIRLLDAIRAHSPATKYLHISSAAVYGNPAELPIAETASLMPLSPYGWHKMISEQICKEYYHLYDIGVCVIRPFSVYGNGLKKQLLWDVCEKLNKSDEISLFGTGEESRDFIHITDLVLLMSKIIENSSFEYDVYNAATGAEVYINHIADLYVKHFSGGKKISFSGTVKAGDPRNWRADMQKLKQIGFESTVTLEDGIKNYINWYKSLNG